MSSILPKLLQVLGETGDSEADKANNNTLNSTDTKPQVMSKSNVHRRSDTPKPTSSSSSATTNKPKGVGNPNRHSFHGIIGKPSSHTLVNVNRNSLYSSCIRAENDSPTPNATSPESPPKSPETQPPPYIPPPNKYVYNNEIYSKPFKKTKSSDKLVEVSSPFSIESDDARVNNLSNLIIQNTVSSKPPLPPRNRPINNNYKPPLPPPNPKPKQSTSPCISLNQLPKNQRAFVAPTSHSNSQFSQRNNITPDFSFSFTKNVSDSMLHPSLPNNNLCIVNSNDVADKNLMNRTMNEYNSSFMVYSASNSCNDGGSASIFGDGVSNRVVMATSVVGEETTYSNSNNNGSCISSTAAPLSSNSSSSSSGSSGGAPRTNSLPRMGVKGKAAAMSARGSPCPPPPPPPKGAPNPLAALRSTAILDNSLFWVRVWI